MSRLPELWFGMWRRPAGSWAGALLLTAVAFALRLALIPVIGTRAPFAFFFPAILISGWLGGLTAGLVSLAASALFSLDLIDPNGRFVAQQPRDVLSLVTFLATGAIVLAVAAGARRSRETTRRERLESQKLRSTLEQALKSARMGYWNWDIATNRVEWSENLEEVHGVPPGTFKGTFESFLSIVHPDDRTPVQDAVSRALAEGSQFHVEFRVPRPEGGVEWVSGDGRVELRDGKPVGMTGIGMNITQRRRADEDRLLLASIVDSSHDAIISKDLDGRLMSWNRAAEKMYGYTAEEAIGQSVAILLPPERADEFDSNMDRIRRGELVVHHETLRRRKDGTVFEAALTISPIHDASGRIIGASKIARDISAVKREERERQRTRDLFLGILGHDLRNPLNTIVTSMFMLEREVPETARRVLPRVARSAERMGRMIEQLLDFTRARLGEGITLTRSDGDLRDISRGVVEDLDPSLSSRVRFNDGVPIAGLWDADRIQQAVSNLIVNALKHGDPMQPVDVCIAGENGQAIIEVTNAGPPIPEGERAHIFEPFRRSSSESSRDSSGLGLGLYIVREIARAHGGTIELESGDGTTRFRLRLPVIYPEIDPTRRQSDPSVGDEKSAASALSSPIRE